MEFSASITHTMHIVNETYQVCTYLRLQHYVSALWCQDKNWGWS